jgi:WD40 repeat protein
MVLDEETAGWRGDGVSVGVEASAEYRHVDQLKEKLTRLASRVEALREAEENLNLDKVVLRSRSQQRSVRIKMASEREGVEGEMAEVESELEAAVAAPAGGGRDPTSWLPDELLMVIVLLLPFETLWKGQYTAVCRRWRTLGESGPVQRRKRTGKWEAYAKGWIQPRRLEGHNDCISCLAASFGDTIYSGSYDGTVRVWRGGKEIRMLEGHTDIISGLAVGPDGTVYTGSTDDTVQVWSGEDGTHIRTLSGHSGFVRSLAVGLNGRLYTGSLDSTIWVWSTRDGAHIQTLEGHTKAVRVLLWGLDGRVYSASSDGTIRVWSGDDGAHLQTLEGHTKGVHSLVWGPEGKLYSASYDRTIRVWFDGGTSIFKTTEFGIASLAWTDGKLFAALRDNLLIWSSDQLSPTDPPSHVLDYAVAGEKCLAGGSSGDLYAVADRAILKM